MGTRWGRLANTGKRGTRATPLALLATRDFCRLLKPFERSPSSAYNSCMNFEHLEVERPFRDFKSGQRTVLTGVSPRIINLLEITRMAQLFLIFPSLADALDGLSNRGRA